MVFNCGRFQILKPSAYSKCPESQKVLLLLGPLLIFPIPVSSSSLSSIILFSPRLPPPPRPAFANLFSGVSAPPKWRIKTPLYNTSLHHGESMVLVISPTHSEASFLLSQATVLHDCEVERFSNLTKNFLLGSNCLIKVSSGCS